MPPLRTFLKKIYYITFIDLTQPFEIYDALDKLWLEIALRRGGCSKLRIKIRLLNVTLLKGKSCFFIILNKLI